MIASVSASSNLRASRKQSWLPVPPQVPIAAQDAPAFDCTTDHVRSARATKRGIPRADVATDAEACGPEGCC